MSEFRVAITSAILASVLTFFATRLNDFLNRLRKRNLQNLNSLVKVEHLVNSYGMVINDNLQSLVTITDAIPSPNVIPLNRLSLVDIEAGVKMGLLDIRLINQITEVEYTLRRLNDDAALINHHLDSFQEGVMSGSVNQVQYKAFLSSLLVDAKSLRAFMTDCIDQLAGLSAYVQLRQKTDRTFTTSLLQKIVSIGKGEIQDDELGSQKKKVLAQIKSNREKSILAKEKIIKEAP